MRAKWAQRWDEVRYCSKQCKQARLRKVDEALEQKVLELTSARGPRATICPSEVARAVGGEDWRPLMKPARYAVNRLAALGRVEVLQKGRAVDAPSAKGPIRVRIKAH